MDRFNLKSIQILGDKMIQSHGSQSNFDRKSHAGSQFDNGKLEAKRHTLQIHNQEDVYNQMN